MIQTLQQLADILQHTELASAQSLLLPIEGSEQQAMAIQVRADTAVSAWETLRQKLAETGRWPLLVTCWAQSGDWAQCVKDENFFARWSFEQDGWGSPALGNGPEQIVVEALKLNRQASLARLLAQGNWVDEPDDEPLDPSSGDDQIIQHLEWFDPQHQTMALILLPTSEGWQAPAFINWFGSQSASSALTVAMLKHWHEQWGAELVAHYGTMLQLKVSRKPESPEAARALAREQAILAPCTLYLPGVSLNDHARALMQTERWFLHERP